MLVLRGWAMGGVSVRRRLVVWFGERAFLAVLITHLLFFSFVVVLVTLFIPFPPVVPLNNTSLCSPSPPPSPHQSKNHQCYNSLVVVSYEAMIISSRARDNMMHYNRRANDFF